MRGGSGRGFDGRGGVRASRFLDCWVLASARSVKVIRVTLMIELEDNCCLVVYSPKVVQLAGLARVKRQATGLI